MYSFFFDFIYLCSFNWSVWVKDFITPLIVICLSYLHYLHYQDLDATIYAQMRAYHFLKWNKSAPEALMKESGPDSMGYTLGSRVGMVLPAYIKVLFCRFIFFTYAILAGLHYSCRE
jgi:hypothetical protein